MHIQVEERVFSSFAGSSGCLGSALVAEVYALAYWRMPGYAPVSYDLCGCMGRFDNGAPVGREGSVVEMAHVPKPVYAVCDDVHRLLQHESPSCHTDGNQ
ncbi:hypothetical protein MAR_011054 [Mya arenaria]|uniref:Uncharacterized protein n=1 Tax=Mya arenaria TaxID=6604 RepID=A0ABY7FTM6_MYAAR|nr:hypothetical protein MAR_011054 [Mya arenaria]